MGHKAAVAPEPGEGPLDNPAPPDKLEASLLVRAFYDLKPNPLRGQIRGELVSLIAAIGKDVADERKQPPGLFDKFRGGVPILHVCRDHLDTKQQADGVDKRVAFDPFDFFARVVANWIGVAPPFSAVFTVWVSIIAAVGEASRPSASRQAMRSS